MQRLHPFPLSIWKTTNFSQCRIRFPASLVHWQNTSNRLYIRQAAHSRTHSGNSISSSCKPHHAEKKILILDPGHRLVRNIADNTFDRTHFDPDRTHSDLLVHLVYHSQPSTHLIPWHRKRLNVLSSTTTAHGSLLDLFSTSIIKRTINKEQHACSNGQYLRTWYNCHSPIHRPAIDSTSSPN